MKRIISIIIIVIIANSQNQIKKGIKSGLNGFRIEKIGNIEEEKEKYFKLFRKFKKEHVKTGILFNKNRIIKKFTYLDNITNHKWRDLLSSLNQASFVKNTIISLDENSHN